MPPRKPPGSPPEQASGRDPDAALWRLGHAAAKRAAALGCLQADPAALAGAASAFVDAVQRWGTAAARPSSLDDRAPGHVHRAEAHLRAHATEPLQVSSLAAACGCSVRLLQLDFRRFRGLTPHAALRHIRLERARADLLAGDGPVAAIARRYLFSNSGRFAAAYAGQFGETPADTRSASVGREHSARQKEGQKAKEKDKSRKIVGKA